MWIEQVSFHKRQDSNLDSNPDCNHMYIYNRWFEPGLNDCRLRLHGVQSGSESGWSYVNDALVHLIKSLKLQDLIS